MRKFIFGVAGAVGVAMLGSCATMSEEQCLAGAWGESGYQDGREGREPSRLAEHAEACAKYGVAPDEAAYFSAREAGLREFCTPQRGFEAGRSGHDYKGVCPADLERDFLPAYEDGRMLHVAESAVTAAQSAVNSARERAADRADKLDAKERELRQEGLTEAQREQIRNRIREVRGELEEARRDMRETEYELRRAERELEDVRYRLGRY